MKRVLVVKPEYSGKRVDRFLAENNKDYSRSFFQMLINQKMVLVNNRSVESSSILSEGQTVEVEFPENIPTAVVPENISLDIVYEDNDIVVINKPAGMVVHPACGNKTGTLANALVYRYKQLPVGDELYRPGLVHRLDKGTSGTIIVAKTEPARYALIKQFEKRLVEKTYLAVVHGVFEERRGTIDAPIGRNLINRKVMEVSSLNSRDAVTEYSVMFNLGKYTVVIAKPKTGRTHQIRVHFVSIGHPIVGDIDYNRFPEDSMLAERPMLHAWKLSVIHPRKKQRMEFVSPLPEDFELLIKRVNQGKKVRILV
ncbi:MAG: RluA family pseudouridine synthase [Elusimicrobiota bacterium]